MIVLARSFRSGEIESGWGKRHVGRCRGSRSRPFPLTAGAREFSGKCGLSVHVDAGRNREAIEFDVFTEFSGWPEI